MRLSRGSNRGQTDQFGSSLPAVKQAAGRGLSSDAVPHSMTMSASKGSAKLRSAAFKVAGLNTVDHDAGQLAMSGG